MANVLKIKKNSTWDSTSNPSNSDVVYGELAWANGTKRLYIGRQSTSGGAVTATRIGGEVGLANDNIVKLDEACSSGEVAVYGSTGLTGRTINEFKSDLSINNVENTALSTWAGSTNITTLGTIGTGTWNGTAIAVAKGGTGATDAGTARTNLGLGTSDNVQFANATVTNLTVNGTTTTVNTNDLVVKDSLIFLAKDQSGTPTLDSGFIIERGSSDNVGLIWDESVNEFSFIATSETGGTDGDVTISSQTNVRASTFYGALSGNVTGNVTGDVDGDCTGNANTATLAGNVTGTVALANGGTGATTVSGARSALGLTIGGDVQAFDADLTALATLSKTDGNFIVGNGSTWVAESGSTARTSLGLGNVENTALSTATIDGGTF
tara:strand:+ start:6120 stop:7262 length:1143 start_codon:yes stop_codon:yes gene_type:complete